LLIFRTAGAPVDLIGNMLAICMLVLGIGTILQSKPIGPIGTGYMCPATFTATYLAPSLLAARAGALPLVFGMTVFAGLLESAIAPLLNRLRAIFPPGISGLVILMIGLSAGIAGLRSVLSATATPVMPEEWWVGAATLAAMVALNVWGVGILRMLCTLIGLAIGYLAAIYSGVIDASALARENDQVRLSLRGRDQESDQAGREREPLHKKRSPWAATTSIPSRSTSIDCCEKLISCLSRRPQVGDTLTP
jgi:NCS2 family nucleobase:cation symporter-2